jgi:hypothetical protein
MARGHILAHSWWLVGFLLNAPAGEPQAVDTASGVAGGRSPTAQDVPLTGAGQQASIVYGRLDSCTVHGRGSPCDSGTRPLWTHHAFFSPVQPA